MPEETKALELTKEASLLVQSSKALFARDVNEVFRIIGDYLDEHELKVSQKVIEEYRDAGRIHDT